MNDKQLVENVMRGLELSNERLLRLKARLGQSVVYAHPDGTPYTIPAEEALERYLAVKDSE